MRVRCHGRAVLVALVACLWCVQAGAEVLRDDISLTRDAAELVLSNSVVALHLDAQSGCLRRVVDRGSGTAVLEGEAGSGDVDLCVDGVWKGLDTGGQWRLVDQETLLSGDGAQLVVRQATAGWSAAVRYEMRPHQGSVSRSVGLTASEGTAGTVRGVRLVLHGVRGGEGSRYSVLANWPPAETALGALQDGRVVGEFAGPMSGHFVLTHSERAGLGLATALVCETEGASTQVVEGAGKITVRHEIGAAWRVRPGREEVLGSQLLGVTSGTWREALRSCQGLYDLVGLEPPQDMLAEARRAVIYSAHSGGSIDSGWQDTGGFTAFARYLPELKRLGINTVWLLPFWKGPCYAPEDYYALDPAQGTEGELRALVDQAHGLGMRVLGDLIPHGPLDSSGLHREHRDWVNTNEDGTMQYWWGCLSCDYAHPGWQQYMGDHARYWVERVGLDGYRVDCAAGGPTNWGPYGDNRPTMSGMFGGNQVLRAAREAMLQAKERVLLLGETGGPQYVRHADIVYDWALGLNVARTYPDWRATEYAPALSRWLENQNWTFPRGANQLRFLENHDTARSWMVYGPGPKRALMALCALVPGTPLVYHFQENGLGPFLQRLYEVRRTVPELTEGEADFLSATCSQPAVMTFVRGVAPDVSLVALNLGGETEECTVSLPAEAAGLRRGLADQLTGLRATVGEGGRLVFTLPPFGVAVFSAQRPDGMAPEAPGAAPEAGADLVADPAGATTLRNDHLVAVIDPARGGLLARLSTPGGQELLAVDGLDEGQRRLWLGPERLALQSRAAGQVERRQDGAAEVLTAHGSVTRERQGRTETVADYSVEYRLAGAAELEVSYALTARVPVREVLGSLAETLRLAPGAREWLVSTAEGCLWDWARPRWSRDVRYGSMYLRGTGDRVWQSEDLALGVGVPVVAARVGETSWVLVEFDQQPSGQPRNVMLKTRSGNSEGLRVVSQWLSGRQPVTLEAGESLRFSYRVRLWEGTGEELRALCERGNALTRGPVTLKVRGSRYELSNGSVECAFSRFGAGRLADLRLAGDPAPMIVDSNVYSDVGIYGDRTTPEMRKVRAYMSSHNDPESSVTVTPGDGEWSLQFEGVFRGDDGRGVASPITRVRNTYRMGAGAFVDTQVAVCTAAELPGTAAFLAQTLTLPRLASYRVNAADGVQVRDVSRETDRVWQSKVAGFGAEPWMECLTGDGRGLRLSGQDLGPGLQNAFLLRSGNGEGVFFLAFNDLEPADIRPVWRPVDYRLTPLREGR